MQSPLTHDRPYGLFVPIMNPATPQDMLKMADRLEDTAKALRQSANLILNMLGGGLQSTHEPLKVDPAIPSATLAKIGAELAKSETSQKFYEQNPPVFVNRTPTVMEAAIEVLKEAGRPVYITDIYEAVKKRGARVQDQANMSSMLSKNKGKDVRVLPGRHGFWELTPQTLGQALHDLTDSEKSEGKEKEDCL